MSKHLIMVFVKNPVPGRVKTRLGKDLGHKEASVVYKKLLQHTRQQVLSLEADKQVWYGEAIGINDVWEEEQFSKRQQNNGTLGERMASAFKLAFDAGYEKVVVVGSDCPEISTDIMNEAFAQLSDHQVVLGPATDGGYYLLGMKKPYALFDDIEWSTDTVLKDTLQKIKNQELQFQLLPELSDLDTIEDLKKFPEYDASN